jgi:diacylglycerol kinase family enzyme
MHVYIYENYVGKGKLAKVMAAIETRLTDLGLNGKIVRLTANQNFSQIIENELRLGAKTIIAVGNDRTLNKTLNAMAAYSKNNVLSASLAMIPVGDDLSVAADALGIGFANAACDVLSARRIEKLDLGEVRAINSGDIKYFLIQAGIPSQGVIIEYQKNTIETSNSGQILAINISTMPSFPTETKPNPQDGKLELVISQDINQGMFKKSLSQSLLPFKKIILMSPKFNLILDNSIEMQTPVEISVIKKKINVIVGKERNF